MNMDIKNINNSYLYEELYNKIEVLENKPILEKTLKFLTIPMSIFLVTLILTRSVYLATASLMAVIGVLIAIAVPTAMISEKDFSLRHLTNVLLIGFKYNKLIKKYLYLIKENPLSEKRY